MFYTFFQVLTGKDASDPTIFEEKKPDKPPEPKKPIVKVETKKPKFFSVYDSRILKTFKTDSLVNVSEKNQLAWVKEVPASGSIYHSIKSRGLSVPLKKELRENGSVWNSVSEVGHLKTTV